MEDREISYLNVIPLVDIMLVLLTIVLTTATFIAQGEIPVNLPGSETAQTTKKIEKVVITIDKKGRIYLQNREVSLESLKAELSKFKKDTEFVIRADKESKVETLVSVLDKLSLLELNRVTLAVERNEL